MKTWERFRGIAFGMEHGLRDWMLMHTFYMGLSETARVFLDKECEGSFMNAAETVPLTVEETMNELLKYPEYLVPFVSHLMCSKTENAGKELEEVKMLSEVNDPMLELENCSLH